MQPVLILQFMRDDGPGYLASWAAREGVDLVLRNAAQGEAFPSDLTPYRGLAVLGGAMSVNDDLPYLREAERLILEAMRTDIPVLGHCLGGQLMARAMGVRVHASQAPEIGWQRVDVQPGEAANDWLGTENAIHVFHWHYESFELPAGSQWIASSPACAHQAFAVGPHLAMQFHVEIDERKIGDWLAAAEPQYAQAMGRFTSVHDETRIRRDTAVHLTAQQRLADRIYGRWRQAMR